MSVLGTEAINSAIAGGEIIVDPFLPELVSINSVDVRLGPELYMLRGNSGGAPKINNLYDPPEDRYILLEPLRVYGSSEHTDLHIEGDNVFTSAPVCPRGEHVPGWILNPGFHLGSTIEAIGTSAESGLIPDMNAKSTMGRNGLTVARCAGRGDVGYAARWTLGIHVTVPTLLCVGTVVGQVRFTRCEGGGVYGGNSSYQPGGTMKMLPKPMKVIPA